MQTGKGRNGKVLTCCVSRCPAGPRAQETSGGWKRQGDRSSLRLRKEHKLG